MSSPEWSGSQSVGISGLLFCNGKLVDGKAWKRKTYRVQLGSQCGNDPWSHDVDSVGSRHIGGLGVLGSSSSSVAPRDNDGSDGEALPDCLGLLCLVCLHVAVVGVLLPTLLPPLHLVEGLAIAVNCSLRRAYRGLSTSLRFG